MIPQIEDSEAQRDEAEETDGDVVDYQRITDLIEENREAEEADAENAEDPEAILRRLEEGTDDITQGPDDGLRGDWEKSTFDIVSRERMEDGSIREWADTNGDGVPDTFRIIRRYNDDGPSGPYDWWDTSYPWVRWGGDEWGGWPGGTGWTWRD